MMPKETIEEPGEKLPDFARIHWPAHLRKATWDHYSYTLALKDGTLIEFEHANPIMSGEWVELHGAKISGLEASTGRGLQVRFSDITRILDHDS
jgi:hypothetical protein